MLEDQPFPLTPINFFAISCDCHYLLNDTIPKLTTYLLPNTSRLCGEYMIAKVAMGWNEEGLGFQVRVNQPFDRCVWPEFQKGDSVELMIDTRDVKSSGFNTRFCHHFYFLPEAYEGNQGEEITHFRTEDSHPLCDPKMLSIQSQLEANDYLLKIFIPSQCLYGYDPRQFDRLGFTYRINRVGGKPQHFSVVSQDYQIDEQPSLWSSLKLVNP